MRTKTISLTLSSLILTLTLAVTPGCGGSRSNDSYFTAASDETETEFTDTDDEPVTDPVPESLPASETEVTGPGGYGDIAIPFKGQGGVKYVDVEINGSIGVHMIIDSGCSGTLISLAEAQYLAQKGVLDEDDIIGQQTAMIADGSITLNTMVRLRQLLIGGKILCSDVTATVADNIEAPLLLGNEVLDRTGAYTVDNDRGLLIFHNVPS